ncbi:hypothetical protein [Streptomyces sp. NBC_00316]|uniref:hypothetical protein n=1 Tax=Streptomyces sp. NBC_00316 TaxID=2975710 RepID=UPI002E2A9190|nr:hypothetical protein [Streptomyces sp. NBC_00316]
MSAPIVVHRCSPAGRVVSINDEMVGVVRDLVELLRRAGIHDAELCLDDPHWIEWRGGRAHLYEAV